MAIDFQSKFDQLFGEETATSAPTLRDVAPGLGTSTTGARFESRELNPRRTAVSARNFRNPRVRSAEGAFDRQGPTQTAQSFAQGAIARAASSEPEATGYGGQPGYQFDDSAAGGGNLAVGTGGAVPNAVIGQIGKGMLTSGLSTAALGTALGYSPSQVLAPSIGSAMQSMVGPAALNAVAGGIISSEIGDYTAENASIEEMGGPYATTNAQLDAARMANMNPAGAVGIVGRQLGSMITDRITSPADLSREARGAQQGSERQQDIYNGAQFDYFSGNSPAPYDTSRFNVDDATTASLQGSEIVSGGEEEEKGLMSQIGSAIGSQFSAPGAEAVAKAEAGGIGGKTSAKASDRMADGSRRGSVLGGVTATTKSSSSGSSGGGKGGDGGYGSGGSYGGRSGGGGYGGMSGGGAGM